MTKLVRDRSLKARVRDKVFTAAKVPPAIKARLSAEPWKGMLGGWLSFETEVATYGVEQMTHIVVCRDPRWVLTTQYYIEKGTASVNGVALMRQVSDTKKERLGK